jgi:hypothetical protein
MLQLQRNTSWYVISMWVASYCRASSNFEGADELRRLMLMNYGMEGKSWLYIF